MKKGLKIILGFVCVLVAMVIIDLICIFTINRPIFVISEDYGDYAIYRGVFFNTYNCPEYSVPQIKAKGTKFSCAFKEELKESTYTPTEVENVSVSISDISLTGATIIIKDTNKNPYTYGEWYKIEQERNGKWYEVEAIIDDYAFTEIGYLPDKNNEVKFVMDWEKLYGELPQGSYRILKHANSETISIQFGIAETSK